VGDKRFFTLELPWRDNQKNISCIPAGEYDVTIRISPRFGRVYWVLKVEGRTYILIHSGNWAGDVSKDLNTHTNGCILLGMKRGYLAGQRAVLMSRTAIRKFMDRLDGANFKLHILEVF
jgi:hypothetical protein